MPNSLVLIRHAHRDLDCEDHDNGLSDRGVAQARAVLTFARARGLITGGDTLFLASPKRRCRETLAPFASAARATVTVDPLLDERTAQESTAGMDARVQTFLDYWRRSPARSIVACSHGDWLPLAYDRLIGQTPDLPNACWLEVTRAGAETHLAWFVPSFDAWVPTGS